MTNNLTYKSRSGCMVELTTKQIQQLTESETQLIDLLGSPCDRVAWRQQAIRLTDSQIKRIILGESLASALVDNPDGCPQMKRALEKYECWRWLANRTHRAGAIDLGKRYLEIAKFHATIVHEMTRKGKINGTQRIH